MFVEGLVNRDTSLCDPSRNCGQVGKALVPNIPDLTFRNVVSKRPLVAFLKSSSQANENVQLRGFALCLSCSHHDSPTAHGYDSPSHCIQVLHMRARASSGMASRFFKKTHSSPSGMFANVSD